MCLSFALSIASVLCSEPVGLEKLLFASRVGLGSPNPALDRVLVEVTAGESVVRRVNGVDSQTGQVRELDVLFQSVSVLDPEGGAPYSAEVVSSLTTDKLIPGKRYLLAGYWSPDVGNQISGTALRLVQDSRFLYPSWAYPTETLKFSPGDSYAAEFRALTAIFMSGNSRLQEWLYPHLPAPSVRALAAPAIHPLSGEAAWMYEQALSLTPAKRLPLLTRLVEWRVAGVQRAWLDALKDADQASSVPEYLRIEDVNVGYDRASFEPGSTEFLDLACSTSNNRLKRFAITQVRRLEQSDVVRVILLMDSEEIVVKSKAADLLAVHHSEPERRPRRMSGDGLAAKLEELRRYWRSRYGLQRGA